MNKLSRPVAMLLAFFFPILLMAAPIKIGVIDTGFCHFKKSYSVKVHSIFKAAGKIHIPPCQLSQKHPRLHGQLVLESFLKNLDKKVKVEIYPIVVFNDKGKQELGYWKKAFNYASGQEIDILLMASSFPYYKRLAGFPKLKILSFVASGTVEGSIKKETSLFPQELTPHEKVIMIGAYSPAIRKNDAIVDSRRKYADKIDYYFPSFQKGSPLTGSSLSVSLALAKALSHCVLEKMKLCLSKKVYQIPVLNLKSSLSSY